MRFCIPSIRILSNRLGDDKILRALHFLEFLIRVSIKYTSTALAQALACASVTQRTPFPSPVGSCFLVRFFRGFSSPVRQMSGSFRPPCFPEYHLAVIIILIIFTFLKWASERCVSSIIFMLSRRWPQNWADHLSGEALHVLVWSKSIMWSRVNSFSRQVVAL